MGIKYFLSFLLAGNLICFALRAQNPTADSLIELLNKTKSDTAQIRLMNDIADAVDDSLVLYYATEAISRFET